MAEWLLHLGKDPTKADGYAHSTSQARMWRLDKFYRWWEHETDGCTERITPTHADAWMQHLTKQELSVEYKTDCQKACKTLFKWQSWKNGSETKFTCSTSWS